VDDEVLDQLEEALIGADVGVDSTLTIIEKIQERVKKTNIFLRKNYKISCIKKWQAYW